MLFGAKGLGQFKGENVACAKQEILAVSCHLNATADFPEESRIDILKGLGRCTAKHFCEFFALCLHQIMEDNLTINGGRAWDQETVTEEIVMIMNHMICFYNNLCTAGEWNNLNGHTASIMVGKLPCWNCGEAECHAISFPNHKDEARIINAHHQPRRL